MDPSPPDRTPTADELANRARAAAAAEALVDAGLPVRVVEDHLDTTADGQLRGWTDDPYDLRNQAAGDDRPDPTGVRITIVEERVAGSPPFAGTAVEWLLHPRVRHASRDALAELMATADGLPDPLPEPMVHAGRLATIMRDAVRAVLADAGFALRDDTGYRPSALWIVGHDEGATASVDGQ